MPHSDPLQLRFDAFELDEANARLIRDGQPVALAPKAFAVLCALARQPGQLLTKNALLDIVWGHQHVSESVLKTVISELRVALSDDAKQPRYIETAARRGYRFIAAAHAREHASTAPRASLMAQRRQTRPMIGRRSALAHLHSACSKAIGGARQICWVAGEAGVGKTTLIDNFVAQQDSVTAVCGQCVEQHGAGEPYLPVLEALATLSRADSALGPLMRKIAPTWLLQLPWLTGESERDTLRRELAGIGQERMLRELGELLERYTHERALLLVTEDLHWSDHATVRLIDHIARRRAPARFMWLASFRLAEVIAEDHPLKALRHELRLHHLCDEIVLDSFSEREVADYVEHRLPEQPVAETLVRALHLRTDGLPLFVVNVIDDLIAQGTLKADGASGSPETSISSLHVPENLAGVIEKQIARLAPEDRDILQAASVCGGEFRAAAVAQALERDSASVSARCDELARQQQWLANPAIDRLPDGSLDARYSFRHALYRGVFYQRTSPLKRAQLHRGIAAALECGRAAGVSVAPAELALHYELSQDAAAALRHYAAAAESALRRFAPREAMHLATHALGLLPNCPESVERVALELALAAMKGVASAHLVGVSSLEAKRAFERARALLKALPQHPMRALVLHALGLVLLTRAEYAELQELGSYMHKLSTELDDRVLFLSACDVLGQMNTLRGSHQEGRDWLTRGVAAGSEIGDEILAAAYVVDPLVTMQAALAMPLVFLGLADQAHASVESAIARAKRLGQPMAKLTASWFGAIFEVRRWNTERVAQFAIELEQATEAGALAQGVAPTRCYRGWAQAHSGQPLEGYRLIREAYDHNASLGMYAGGPEVLCYGAEALVLAGDFAAAQTQLDEAIQLAEKLGERAYRTEMLIVQGRIACGQGAVEAARAAMLAAVAEARAQQALWLEVTALIALCELDDSRPEDCNGLREACARLKEGLDTPLVARAHELLRAH